MIFSLIAKLGFLQTPINNSASVTDSELILDVDPGANSFRRKLRELKSLGERRRCSRSRLMLANSLPLSAALFV
jgi:hypothetical protein